MPFPCFLSILFIYLFCISIIIWVKKSSFGLNIVILLPLIYFKAFCVTMLALPLGYSHKFPLNAWEHGPFSCRLGNLTAERGSQSYVFLLKQTGFKSDRMNHTRCVAITWRLKNPPSESLTRGVSVAAAHLMQGPRAGAQLCSHTIWTHLRMWNSWSLLTYTFLNKISKASLSVKALLSLLVLDKSYDVVFRSPIFIKWRIILILALVSFFWPFQVLVSNEKSFL